MSIFQQQRVAEVDRRDSLSHKGQVEALNAQRKELEELRMELRKHEQVSFVDLLRLKLFRLILCRFREILVVGEGFYPQKFVTLKQLLN